MTQTSGDNPILKLTNTDAEEAVIGSLLLRGSPDEKALVEIAFLAPADFFREKNRWIFEGMLALARAGTAIDQVTVAHWLQEHDRVEDIGGYAYLLTCLAGVATSYHLKYYAEIVHDLAERRRMIAEAGRMAKDAYEGKPDIPVIPL